MEEAVSKKRERGISSENGHTKRIRTSSANPAVEETNLFVHTPLRRNHGEVTIRLLQFCDDGPPENPISMTMSHTEDWDNDKKAATKYTCLSYRWGDDEATHTVLINGKTRCVRQNLFDFLDMWKHGRRRRRNLKRWFWIDALCIDQTNAAERNHQVQKMGQIYSNAEEVIVWLGKEPALDHFLRSTSLSLQRLVSTMRSYGLDHELQVEHILRQCILRKEYWNRAWITQEVVLAKKTTLAVNDQSVQLEELDEALRGSPVHGSAYESGTPFKEITVEKHAPSAESITSLLARFYGKRCSIPRDRIYSLLSICSGGHGIEVDYELPSQKLMYHVLQRNSRGLCFCTARMVALSLELENAVEQTGSPSGFEGYICQPLRVIQIGSSTQDDHSEQAQSRVSEILLGKSFDYSIKIKLCGQMDLVVSWNEPSSCCEEILICAFHPYFMKIFVCSYGDGFEILDFAKVPPATMEQRRTKLAELWERRRQYYSQLKMDLKKGTNPMPYDPHEKSWTTRISFRFLAKLSQKIAPLDIRHHNCDHNIAGLEHTHGSPMRDGIGEGDSSRTGDLPVESADPNDFAERCTCNNI